MILDLFSRIAPALLASLTAVYIAKRVYLRQKYIDRQTAAGSEVRNAHAQFLAAFELVRDRWTYTQTRSRSVEEADARLKLFVQLQWLQIFADTPSARYAEELFNADEREAFARRNMIGVTHPELLEKSEQEAYEASQEVLVILRRYLLAVREEHREHLGHAPSSLLHTYRNQFQQLLLRMKTTWESRRKSSSNPPD